MGARPLNLAPLLAIACAAMLGTARGDESARGLVDEAVGDLEALRQGGLPREVDRQVASALSALGDAGPAFTDANHVSTGEAFDRLR